MTDAEVICAFMEPISKWTNAAKKQGIGPDGHRTWVWWEWRPMTDPFIFPKRLTLDRLREVQERLTDAQWESYEEQMTGQQVFDEMDGVYRSPKFPRGWSVERFLLHASAEQKIAALAAVLRDASEVRK
jgi:hypothetical protein